MSTDNHRHRLGLLAITALSLFGALFARLWFLQIVEGATASELVSANATRTVIVPAPRGRILDRHNVVLVDNQVSTVVAVDWQKYRDMEEDEQAELLDRLSSALSRVPEGEVEGEPGAEGEVDGEGEGGSTDTETESGDGTEGDEGDQGADAEVEADPAVDPTAVVGGEEDAGAEGAKAVTVDFLEKRLNDSRFNHFRPIPVADDIPVETEIFLREQSHLFPNVVVERRTVRAYPYGSLAAHLLGYVGPLSDEQWEKLSEDNDPTKPYEQADQIGKAGVEATYEQYLRGTPGRQVFEVDRAGRIVREMVDRRVDPEPGDDVHLSIDIRIQYKTEEALAAQLARPGAEAKSGAAVVVDPRNGQVRAMASWPTYDPQELVGGISQELWERLTAPETKVLSNRTIQEAYPAASTFKLASSYAGLRMGIIEPDVAVADPGTHQLCNPPRNTDGCLKKNSGGGAGMGYITLPTALTRSSDVYFYKLGETAYYRDGPEDAFQQEIMTLGYGSRTGIDLTGESPGRVPTPESNRNLADSLWERSRENYDNDEAAWQDARRWKVGYSADVAIGQFDTLVTPLQTAMAYSALANSEGRLYQPSVLSHVARANSATIVKGFEATITRIVEWGDWRQSLLDGFAGVTQQPGGTGYLTFQDFPLSTFPVSGKTGTAEVGDGEDQRRDNSLFVAYGPNPDPTLVVSVMVEGGGFGSEAAAPATYMILKPIADGEFDPEQPGGFVVPRRGFINAEAAAAAAEGIGRGSAD
jgi:penicillin-binding protein 2